MKLKRIICGLLGMSFCLSANAHAAGPFGSIEVAGWSGGAFTSDNTGKFTSCFASASYQSGVTFSVIITPNYAWSLAFQHPAWKMAKGEAFPIRLTFDNRKFIDVTGRVASSRMVLVPMPDQSNLIQAFRSSHVMSALAQGSEFRFKLDGTSSLILSLVNCVKVIKEEGIAGARNFTYQAARAPTQQMGPGVSSSPPPKSSVKDYSAEAAVIAANVLSQAGISGFRILTKNEMSEIKADAAWITSELMGAINVFPEIQVEQLDKLKGGIIGETAKSCTGTFFSGSMDDINEKQLSLARLFTTCQNKSETVTSYYFAVKRKAGGIYLIKTTSSSGDEKPIKEADAGIRRAFFTALPHDD